LPDHGPASDYRLTGKQQPKMTDRVFIPEVVEPDSALPRDLQALKRFAILLDASIQIPGMRRKVGLAPAVGLIPGVGDAVGALLASWIVVGAFRYRVPGTKIARMITNILVDLWVGSIPVIGDIIDFLWPENLQNVELLLRYRDRRRPPRSLASLALVIAMIFVLISMASLLAVGLVILALYLLLRDFPLV